MIGGISNKNFISTWLTTNAGSASNTIVIPTSSTGTYNCTVYWGDGTSNTITTYNDAAWTHVYGSTGTYTITISGTFTGLVFNNGGDKLKLLNISNWGQFRLGTNQGAYFFGCSNLTITALDILDLSVTTSLVNCFNACSKITTIPSINSWNFTTITTMAQTFLGCSLFNQNLTGMNTLNCTTFNQCFRSCTVFNGLVTGINTISCINLGSTFMSCPAFNQSVSHFSTAVCTNMSSLFNGCFIFNQSVSNFNTSLVTTFQAMFAFCAAFNQSVLNFNTSSVIGNGFATMFSGCSVFSQPVSHFITSGGTNFTNMFSSATLCNPDVSTWNIQSLTNATNMMLGSAFDITNYDKLLNNTTGWPSQATVNSSVVFSAGTAHYSAGAPTTGRAFLTGTKVWTITDGGTP